MLPGPRRREVPCLEMIRNKRSLPVVQEEPDTARPRQPFPEVPKGVPLKAALVLHLFSGQRRTGDFQYHFEALAAQAAGSRPVFVISVDIVLHSRGDLTNEGSLALWTNLVLERIAVFVLGGPPCETRSPARPPPLGDDDPASHQGVRKAGPSLSGPTSTCGVCPG